jgi:hypothetical protein
MSPEQPLPSGVRLVCAEALEGARDGGEQLA